MTPSPTGPASAAPTIRLRFKRPEDLHHFFFHDVQRDTLVLDARHHLMPGTPVNLVLSVSGCTGTLRLGGAVTAAIGPYAGDDLLIRLDDSKAAVSSVASFVAYVDSLLLVTADPPSERRWGPRISVTVPVWIRFKDSGQFVSLYTRDVSRTGLFVFTTDVRAPGTPGEVLLVPPGQERSFALSAIVARAVYPSQLLKVRSGMGLCYTDVPKIAVREIDRFLRGVVGIAGPPEGEDVLPPATVETYPPNGLRSLGVDPDRAPPNRSGRRLGRVQARLRVMLRPTNFDRFRELYTRDISRGGLFVETERPPPVGTRVEVVLAVPGVQETFSFEGEVVHASELGRNPGTDPPGVGIRLADRSQSCEALERIIRRLLDESAPPPPRENEVEGEREPAHVAVDISDPEPRG